MGRITKNLKVTKVSVNEDGTIATDTRTDTVSVEEPLEIHLDGKTITTTMRTPGDDIELAHGFLYGEGLITSAEEIATARYCAGAVGPRGENTYNVLELERRRRQPIAPEFIRLTTTTSACGVCGSTSIDAITAKARHEISPLPLDAGVVDKLPGLLREHQRQFRRTGAVHAAGALSADGEPIVVREDVGRHNAADKVIGRMLLDDHLPAENMILTLSSRASFELIQKAVMAGFSAVVAVSAPTTLAIELARETGIALVGFTRPGRFNLYSGTVA